MAKSSEPDLIESPKSKVGYMLDTCAFNKVLDGAVPIAVLEEFNLFATHIQQNELAATQDGKRRESLLALFHIISAAELPTETFVLDVSELGKAKLSDGSGILQSLQERIKELDGKDRGLNQAKDALMAKTAIKRGLVLITTDKKLAQAVREHGGRVEDVSTFRNVD